MSLRRTLSWSAAMRDTRAAGPARSIGTTGLVNANGTFNLSAIMKAATALARRTYNPARKAILSWSAHVAGALRSIWKRAQAERSTRQSALTAA